MWSLFSSHQSLIKSDKASFPSCSPSPRSFSLSRLCPCHSNGLLTPIPLLFFLFLNKTIGIAIESRLTSGAPSEATANGVGPPFEWLPSVAKYSVIIDYFYWRRITSSESNASDERTVFRDINEENEPTTQSEIHRVGGAVLKMNLEILGHRYSRCFRILAVLIYFAFIIASRNWISLCDIAERWE